MSKDFNQAETIAYDVVSLMLEYKQLAESREAIVIRFIFTDFEGQIHSITSPASAFKVENPLILLDILQLTHCEGEMVEFLLPDLNTAFLDPCSVQPTLCILCSVVKMEQENLFAKIQNEEELQNINLIPYDARAELYFKESSSDLSPSYYMEYHFSLCDDSEEVGRSPLDTLHDLRSDIILELIRAAVDVQSHRALKNNDVLIKFRSPTLLKLCDDIQKFRIIAENISASYGKYFSLPFEVNEMMTNNSKISIYRNKKNSYTHEELLDGTKELATKLWGNCQPEATTQLTQHITILQNREEEYIINIPLPNIRKINPYHLGIAIDNSNITE